MIKKISAEKRFYKDLGWLKKFWLFSFSDYYDPMNIEFGALRVFNDDIIMPNAGFPSHPHENFEIVTIVLSGKLTHKDGMGNEEVISAGEMQKMSPGERIVHSEFNLGTEPVHLYQIWFNPTEKLKSEYDHRAIDLNSNGLTTLASIDDKSTISLKSEVIISKLNLNPDQQFAYKLNENGGLFAYVEEGDLLINDGAYMKGDQARITGEAHVSFKATGPSSVILIESIVERID